MKKSTGYFVLLFLLVFSSCQEPKKISKYADPNLVDQVGDIVPNASLDGDFENCNIGLIPQYYAYKEKPFLKGKLDFENYIRKNYKAPYDIYATGLLRIRFVVNCHGKAGRFRLLAMDQNYEEMDFSDTIVDQLLGLTKSYDAWRVLSYDSMESDYYFYVTFKLDDGHILEVLP